MSSAARPRETAADDAAADRVVAYPCVCGVEIGLSTRSGGRCPDCGRRYAAEVAQIAAAETIRMPGGDGATGDGATGDGCDEPPLYDEPLASTEGRIESADPEDATTRFSEEADAGEGPPLPSGRRLGHFRVVGRLGRGGMGDVYRALDESLQRYVALKVLRPGSRDPAAGDGPDVRGKALLEEARAQARVSHPGVVHIYYVGSEGERPFLAMELVPGPTLAERLRGGPLSYAEAADVALQLALALRHAAKYDVVHGDIKPGNVLVAPEGRMKLSDFGLSRRISTPRDGGAPGGPITGTPNYLPPEVLDGADPDVRADMYSLGVMLFELTFGRRPYRVDSGKLKDQIAAHRTAPPEFPLPWPAEIPSEWRGVLARLLAKKPADRYVDYDLLIADLERLRPVRLPRAGKAVRVLAWLTDLFLTSAMRGVFLAPFAFPSVRAALADQVLVRLTLTSLGLLVPVAACWLQGVWGTSPGKALLQLRIVDRHGLPPVRSVLAARMAVQLLPVWGIALMEVFALGLHVGVTEFMGELLAAAFLLASLCDAAFAAVRRDARSLHDLAFGTRVTLDLRTRDERAA